MTRQRSPTDFSGPRPVVDHTPGERGCAPRSSLAVVMDSCGGGLLFESGVE